MISKDAEMNFDKYDLLYCFKIKKKTDNITITKIHEVLKAKFGKI